MERPEWSRDALPPAAQREPSRTDDRRSERLSAELDGLLDSVVEGVLLFDAGDLVRRANLRFRQLFGVDPQHEERLGSFDALVAELSGRVRDPEAFAERWRQRHAPEEAAAVDEFELHAAGGRKILERYTRPIHSAAGERLGTVEVYRDLTGERLIHNKLVQTEKLAALGQLVSGIAHELNNPLTSIMGYAQLQLARRQPAERGADAEKIYQEAERAARLVRNLLLFSRETKPERLPVDLNETVERTLDLRSYELKLSNIQVALDLDPALPRTLADAHQLQQVILNLLVNAEQAIQQYRGQGHIRIRTQCIAGRHVALEVADDGPGIPPALASRVFDPFFTTKPLGAGTGLGLSIAYGIVQEHGGEIYVESQPGRGATFIMELPAVSEADAAAPAREAPAAGTAPPPARAEAPARGRSILVVEDEPTVAQLVVDVLAEQGHHVEAVLDSREGLERALAGGYDLVICDLRMPRLDGRGFYQALVAEGHPLRQRIFFITGDTLAPRTLEFLEQVGIPYLAKPFLVEELTLAVNRAFHSGPSPGEGGENGGGRGRPVARGNGEPARQSVRRQAAPEERR
jgi:signal transduction histidine kinase/CheY-like chemotaxis protein